jgi:hypothetical protein
MVAAATLLAFAAITIESASAHDKSCDGNPVPGAIKLNCCGKADEHQLKPEQISRGPDGEYIVSVENYTFVIQQARRCPATIIAAISSSRTCGISPVGTPCARRRRRSSASSRRWTSDHAPEAFRRPGQTRSGRPPLERGFEREIRKRLEYWARLRQERGEA